jgi:hypothetical protein
MGNSKSFCNVFALQMNVGLVHLNTRMSGSQHRDIYAYTLARPCGFRAVRCGF